MSSISNGVGDYIPSLPAAISRKGTLNADWVLSPAV